MFSCILVTQLIDDLMQQSLKLGVRLRSGDVQNLCLPQLTGTFWMFAGSVNTYFVTSVSAEVRDTSARWVGSRGRRGGGSSFGKLYFQDPIMQFFLWQLRDLALPEPPRSLLLVSFVATVPQSRFAAVSW